MPAPPNLQLGCEGARGIHAPLRAPTAKLLAGACKSGCAVKELVASTHPVAQPPPGSWLAPGRASQAQRQPLETHTARAATHANVLARTHRGICHMRPCPQRTESCGRNPPPPLAPSNRVPSLHFSVLCTTQTFAPLPCWLGQLRCARAYTLVGLMSRCTQVSTTGALPWVPLTHSCRARAVDINVHILLHTYTCAFGLPLCARAASHQGNTHTCRRLRAAPGAIPSLSSVHASAHALTALHCV